MAEQELAQRSLWLVPGRVLAVCGLSSPVLGPEGSTAAPAEARTQEYLQLLAAANGIKHIIDLHHSREPPRYPLTDFAGSSWGSQDVQVNVQVNTVRLPAGGRLAFGFTAYLPLARFLRLPADGPVAIACGSNLEPAKLHVAAQLVAEGASAATVEAVCQQLAALPDPIAAAAACLPPLSHQQAQQAEIQVLHWAEDEGLNAPPPLAAHHLQWQLLHDADVYRLSMQDLASRIASKELLPSNGQLVRLPASRSSAPLQNFSWLVPGTLAGSALVGCLPALRCQRGPVLSSSSSSSSSSGSSAQTAVAASPTAVQQQQQGVQLEFLKAQGISGIVNLCSEFPALLDPSLLAAAGLAYLHVPVPDMHAPTLQQLDSTVEWIEAHQAACREQQRPAGVVVHCLAGQGRTGTVLAAWLMLQALKGQQAAAWRLPGAAAAVPWGAQQEQQQQEQVAAQAPSQPAGSSVAEGPRHSLSAATMSAPCQANAAAAAGDDGAAAASGAGAPAASGVEAGSSQHHQGPQEEEQLLLPLSAEQAIARVRLLRPNSIESYLQERALQQYQEHLTARWLEQQRQRQRQQQQP